MIAAIPSGLLGRVGVTRQQVQARTREIAAKAGRVAPHVMQADYEQAKREMTGAAEPEQQDAILDAAGDAAAGPRAPA